MKSFLKKFAGGAAVVLSSGLLSTAALADPLSVQYSDVGNAAYWGGVGEGNLNQDIIGGPTFEIFGGDVKRTGNDLSVVIYGNYFSDYQTNSAGLLGTDMGALFIGYKENFTPYTNGSGANHYYNDTYFSSGSPVRPGDADRFSYAFDFGTASGDAPVKGVDNDGGNGKLYAIAGPGDVVGTSDANTNRNLQAYDVGGSARNIANVTNETWTWKLGEVAADNPGYGNQVGTLTYTITNFFTYAVPPLNLIDTSLVLAWTMSCGNDVALFITNVPGKAGDIPIPAGLVLLMTGLVGLAGLGRVRSRQLRVA